MADLPQDLRLQRPLVFRDETGQLRYSGYQQVHTLAYTIEEINYSNILPNITLGFRIYDDCILALTAIKGTMWLVTGQDEPVPNYQCESTSPLAAVIGTGYSVTSIPVARLLGLYRIPQLLHYMKNVHFTTRDGMVISFDKNGDPLPVYDIINWQITPNNTVEYVTIGTLDFSTIKEENPITIDKTIVWNGGQSQVPRSVCSENCPPGYRKALLPGQPVCCFDCILCSAGEISNHTDATECLKCPDDQWSNELQDQCIPKIIEFLTYEEAMGATLATVSILCALASTTVLCIFIKYRNTPIVKANNRELSYLLLLSLVLCFLSSLVFIGQPKSWSCMLRQTAFGIIFALSVSCVLAKTIMVVIAFNATKPNSNLKKWVGPKLSNSIVFVCTVIQVIICIAWLASAPPFHTENMKSQIGKIIIECNEGSITAFWCVLGYLGLLAIVSFIVAFLARNLPDSFNEAKFITFSMLIFISVWLAFIPVYLSTKGKSIVAVEILAILVSSAGLLACIFFPKCYIILLRPDMNTRESLIGKGKLCIKHDI
nr:PREDICTED: vomeronasal type-2 receptor 26-like [Latimeria chalumnae]|eukprot:XP_014353598.1 PREDICTED: vomeronasal type-2 receptor 26-like [Latimeria chalumnae]